MNRKKSFPFFLAMTACLSLGLGGIQSKAYTEEEKAYIKSMLQAYGYSPDMAGANQAYQDYLSGKYNDICEQYGLPKQNVGADTSGSSDGQGSGETAASGDGSQSSGTAEDDGRIHFNQARSEEGVYSVTLKEIWVEDAVQAPVVTAESSRIDSQETDMQYADLVFEVTNEGAEDMNVSELLRLTLNDHTTDYTESLIRKESAHGTDLTEETTLAAGETGIFHYITLVPKTSESFIGKATLNGTFYEIRFDTRTNPGSRERLEAGQTLESADFAAVTISSWVLGASGTDSAENETEAQEAAAEGEKKGTMEAGIEETENAARVENNGMTVDNSSENLVGGAKKLRLNANVKNLSEEEKSSDGYLGLLILADGNIYRGQVTGGGSLASGEEREVTLEAVLPGDVTEENAEILVYFDGTWYAL